jgi:hypothetical protein
MPAWPDFEHLGDVEDGAEGGCYARGIRHHLAEGVDALRLGVEQMVAGPSAMPACQGISKAGNNLKAPVPISGRRLSSACRAGRQKSYAVLPALPSRTYGAGPRASSGRTSEECFHAIAFARSRAVKAPTRRSVRSRDRSALSPTSPARIPRRSSAISSLTSSRRCLGASFAV